MILPPEKLFLKVASITTKIVGYFFIIDGIAAFLVLTPLVFLSKGEKPEKIFFISIVFIGSLLSVLMGLFVLKDAMRYIEIIHAKFKESF